MTAGVDFRPVTATGSVRASDKHHDRAMYNAMLEKQQQVRRAHAAEVREQIEDFEHKLGWKMRKHLGPTWTEQRALELEEERTMGLKRLAVPRPPSPVSYYDYRVNDPTANPAEYESMEFEDTATSGDHQQARPFSSSTPPHRPATSFSANLSRSSALSATRPASRRFGVMKGSMEMWTSQSMLEPIFMPTSATTRAHVHNAQMMTTRMPAAVNKQRRWEDGPGKQFWEMQDRQLRGALTRNEGLKLKLAQREGEEMDRVHQERRWSAQRKKEQAFQAAKQRKEPFPRAKLFAEVRLVEQMKQEWQARENRRLRLGMDAGAQQAEAATVAQDTADFERRLHALTAARRKR